MVNMTIKKQKKNYYEIAILQQKNNSYNPSSKTLIIPNSLFSNPKISFQTSSSPCPSQAFRLNKIPDDGFSARLVIHNVVHKTSTNTMVSYLNLPNFIMLSIGICSIVNQEYFESESRTNFMVLFGSKQMDLSTDLSMSKKIHLVINLQQCKQSFTTVHVYIDFLL